MTGPTDDDQRRSPETGATAREEDRLRHAFALIAAELAAEPAEGEGDKKRRAARGTDPTPRTDALRANTTYRADAAPHADKPRTDAARTESGADATPLPIPLSTPSPTPLPIPPRLLRPPRFSRPAWRRARAVGSGLVALAACATLFTVVARTGGGDADGAASGADDRAAAKTARRCDADRTVVRGEFTAVRALPDGRVRVTVRVSDWLRPASGEPSARFDVPAPAEGAYEAGQRVLVEVPRQEDAPPRVTTGERATERRLRVLGCG